jgi:hypothetical protein
MRTLQLSHEQIEMILNVLNQAEKQSFDIVNANSFILNEDSRKALLKQSNDFNQLSFLINNSELDV